MDDRCTGHCCQNFSLLWSPEALRDAYQRWLAQASGGVSITKARASAYPFPIDIHLIYPMVEYLGDNAPEVKHINPLPELADGKREYRYRCKHWDPATGDCTIYDIRPQMCRDYPGEKGCNYVACTWTAERQKPKTTP